jgi:hypothetical protein
MRSLIHGGALSDSCPAWTSRRLSDGSFSQMCCRRAKHDLHRATRFRILHPREDGIATVAVDIQPWWSLAV